MKADKMLPLVEAAILAVPFVENLINTIRAMRDGLSDEEKVEIDAQLKTALEGREAEAARVRALGFDV